jgi:DNA-binding transcriptional LysR family regulator
LTIAEELLPRWLTRFQRAHPDTAVELEVDNSAHVIELVRRGKAELGFIECADVPSGLRWREVARDELVVVVEPSHPWAKRRTPLSPLLLASEPLVMREPGSGTREVFETALERAAGVRPSAPVLELGSTSAIRTAVMGHAGPAVLSRLAVESDVLLGRLVIVPTEHVNFTRRLRAIWQDDSALSLSVASLLAQLTDQGR